jgi:hypothetical protein
MKKLILFTAIFTFLIACENNSDNSWVKIDFKSNYTIQIPEGFVGLGMNGFEGNTFSKHSTDNKINLTYAYCNGLFCSDFGDPLTNPAPVSIQVMNNYSQLITLDKIKYFYQNSDTTGVLYYSNNDIAIGRLFWKDDNILKTALEIDFNYSEIETVDKIIKTIERK